MLKGLVDAYRYLENDSYLNLALRNASFIEKEMRKPDGGLFRNHKKGKSNINGFLEDYATVIEAYIALYEVTFDVKWLNEARNLTDYTISHFQDSESKLFYFTSDEDDSLIRRSIESYDKEVSASNSIMGKNLLKLHKVYMNSGYGRFSASNA